VHAASNYPGYMAVCRPRCRAQWQWGCRRVERFVRLCACQAAGTMQPGPSAVGAAAPRLRAAGAAGWICLLAAGHPKWAGTSTRYYANSSPASKETACAAPLCTPPPAARPRPWPGRCRSQYYECEWGRQRRAPTSLAPPVPQCGLGVIDREIPITIRYCYLVSPVVL
jgi:hypothetical protein